MTRSALFDAIKPFAPHQRFTPAMVTMIDDLGDRFGLARPEPSAEPGPPPAPPPTGIPDDYWPMLRKIESGDNPLAKAGTSSASGLYQFIRTTWLGEGGRWGTDMSKPFGGLKPDRAEQDARARTFTTRNAAILVSKGIPINKASLYAAHFAGAGMAAKLIGADVKARADDIAGEAATKANRSILEGKTVGDFLTWLHKKTGDWAR